MRVALCIRSDSERSPGGDYVHVRKCAETLRQMGVEAEIVLGTTDLRGFDLVHAFNLTRAANSVAVARNCRRRGIPYVVTPIWHSVVHMAEFYGSRLGLRHGFPMTTYLAAKEPYYERNLSSLGIAFPTAWKKAVRRVLTEAAAVLPNSPEELTTLEAELGIELTGAQVVPFGVDLKLTGVDDRSSETERCHLVCSGRVEPRKNTLAVTRAFLDSSLCKRYSLLLLGKPHARHERYCRRVNDLVDGRTVKMLGSVPYSEALKVYRTARIVVLASFFETCGMVGLEGLACGAEVVMTQKSYNEFYFGKLVEYCDPYSEDSIRNAMEMCAARRTDQKETASKLARFGWTEVCLSTKQVYEQVLSRTL